MDDAIEFDRVFPFVEKSHIDIEINFVFSRLREGRKTYACVACMGPCHNLMPLV